MDPLEKIIAQADLPTLPTIYTRLDETINSPRASIADIGGIVGSDPALTARLLRIANSAFYNFPSEIETVSRALTLVGTKQLRDLVLATLVMDAFDGIASDVSNVDQFWRHSIGVGISARVLATYLREPNVEYFFVMGLLHDVGRLVINVCSPDISRQALKRSKESDGLLYKIEQELFGFDHAGVGQKLLENWGLPASLSQPVGAHHEPSSANAYPQEAAIVHVADIFVSGLMLGSSGQYAVPPMDRVAWDLLGLGYDVFSTLFSQIEEQYGDAIKVFMSEAA